MFKITRQRGFHMKFANGWTASVQWGPMTYSSNHDNWNYDAPTKEGLREWTAGMAEVAAFSPDDEGLATLGGGGSVQGYVTADQALEFLNLVATDPKALSTWVPTSAACKEGQDA